VCSRVLLSDFPCDPLCPRWLSALGLTTEGTGVHRGLHLLPHQGLRQRLGQEAGGAENSNTRDGSLEHAVARAPSRKATLASLAVMGCFADSSRTSRLKSLPQRTQSNRKERQEIRSWPIPSGQPRTGPVLATARMQFYCIRKFLQKLTAAKHCQPSRWNRPPGIGSRQRRGCRLGSRCFVGFDLEALDRLLLANVGRIPLAVQIFQELRLLERVARS